MNEGKRNGAYYHFFSPFPLLPFFTSQPKKIESEKKMYATTFLLLFSFAALFGLIAAFSNDRISLAPMGGMLILIASMLLLSNSFMVQDGVDIQQENISADTTHINKTYTYQDVNSNYEPDIIQLFSFLLIAGGLYSVTVAFTGREGGVLK